MGGGKNIQIGILLIWLSTSLASGKSPGVVEKTNSAWKSIVSTLFEWEGLPIQDFTQGSNEGNVFAGDTIPDWIVGGGTAPLRGATNGSGVRITEVMMQRPEVALVASYLKENDTMLEWGSGGSTLVFGKMVASYDSIEHNCSFAESVRDQIDDHFSLPPALRNETAVREVKEAQQRAEKIRVHCSEVQPGTGNWGITHAFEHGSYRQFKHYVDAVDQIARGQMIDAAYSPSNVSTSSPVKFDKVLIDGRARMACALRVLPYLKPTSVVFLHDFYTRVDLYSGVLDYYDEVSRVLAYPNQDPRMGQPEEPQGLVVLKRKTSVTDDLLPLTDMTINAKYDKINWRDFDPKPPLTKLDRVLHKVVGIVDLRAWKRLRGQNALYEAVKGDVKTFLFLGLLIYAAQTLLLRARERKLKRPGRRQISRFGMLTGTTQLLPSSQNPPAAFPVGGEVRHRGPRLPTSGPAEDQTPTPTSAPAQDLSVTLVDSDAVSRAASRRRGLSSG